MELRMSGKLDKAQLVRVDGRFVLPVVLVNGEDGYVVATCPILPGCVSQGATREQALANIAEAAQLTLVGRIEEGWDLASEYSLESVEVSA